MWGGKGFNTCFKHILETQCAGFVLIDFWWAGKKPIMEVIF